LFAFLQYLTEMRRLSFSQDGYRPTANKDPFLVKAEAAIKEFAMLVEPGTWIVDFIPILRLLPGWFPGASFKRDAPKYHESSLNLSIRPWNMIKEQLKSGTAPESFCADLITKNQGRNLTNSEELYLAWTVGNIYAGGSDTVKLYICAYRCICLYPGFPGYRPFLL